ncbi:hypothetical protein GGR50DRAFT_418128 [Xylaria sp. CBS 124048]|nr:hypothetical protein GGR50DRAFT_418128 [Xylaria sp. CBS 124048]
MSDSEGPDRPIDYNDDNTPSPHPPWPLVDSRTQRIFEQRFIVEGETINFNAVQNMQTWARFFGISEQFRVYPSLKRVSDHSTGANRPLTGTEATAIAQHSVHAARFFAWTQPETLFFAAMAALTGRKTFRFPLYTPKMKSFNPQTFPWRRLPLLRGQMAVYAWHLVRMAAYVPIVWVPTALVFSSIANNSFNEHVLRDPRLSNLREDVRARNAQGTNSRGMRPLPEAQNTVGASSPQDQQQTPEENYSESTTQYYESDGYAAQPSSTPSVPYGARKSTIPGSGSRHEDDEFDSFDDDASPVAPSAVTDEAASSSSSGNPWDRIRQKAKSGSATWERGDSSGQEHGWGALRQDKAQQTRDSTPKTDNYSYSDDDEAKEKRNYEREKAQKEFDDLIEAERRGDNGDSSNKRGGRRW